MKKIFVPAVQSIPGGGVSNKHSNDEMDVDGEQDDGGGGLITRAMQNQSRAAEQRTNGANHPHATTTAELESAARRAEERNMHSLYRLLSRCVQLLDLMSYLERAHSTPALPEVQWGLLHGLTFYQLATSQEGQQRVESLLNALVSRGEKMMVKGLSTDGDLLAETLSRRCYLFFSSASRLTYLGFRSANDALSRPPTSPQRGVLANQAASYLRAASRHWYAPTLVAGRLLPKNNGGGMQVSWEEVATNAANFGGAKVKRDERKELGEDTVQDMMGWERGLYHRPPPTESDAAGGGGMMDSRSAGTRAIVTGMDVTSSDALRTCHSRSISKMPFSLVVWSR